MNTLAIQTIILAVIGGFGMLLIVISFTMPVTSMTHRIREDATGARIEGMVDSTVFTTLITDLSLRIKNEGDDLQDRLRRSGWYYSNSAEFYSKRMLYALLLLIVFTFAGVLVDWLFGLSLGIFPIALLSTLGAIVGFSLPGMNLNKAINQRRERLKVDMSYGLERIALFLQSGSDLADALAQTEGMGIFGDACEFLAKQINTNVPISDAIEKVLAQLPKTAELDEFLVLVLSGIQKGEAVEGALRTMSESMRDELSLAIIERGHMVQSQVTLITIGFSLVAFMLASLTPLLILMFDQML